MIGRGLQLLAVHPLCLQLCLQPLSAPGRYGGLLQIATARWKRLLPIWLDVSDDPTYIFQGAVQFDLALSPFG